jgi:hypothetical protein
METTCKGFVSGRRQEDNQIRVDLEEFHRFVRQILAPMSGTVVPCQKHDLGPNDRFNVISHFNAALCL